MINSKKFCIVQNSILIIPPIFFTIIFPINDYMNFIETLAGYSCGLSGLFIMFAIYSIIKNDTISSAIFIILFLFFYNLLFTKVANTSKKQEKLIIFNIIFSSLRILFGMFWMFAAMQ